MEAMEAKRLELNRMIIELLRPEMAKVKELMEYSTEATNVFRSTIDKLVSGVSTTDISISEGLSLSLMNLLDLILKLDHLKDMKGSIKNDFARYKRAVGSLQSQPSGGGALNSAVSATALEEMAVIQAFISSMDPKKDKNYIFGCLREEVKRIGNHEVVLAKILDHTVYLLENGHHITPNDKFKLVRVLPHLILLLCADEPPAGTSASAVAKANVFKHKQYKTLFARCQKIFKQFPVTPLYADMSITLVYVLERAGIFYDAALMGRDWGAVTDVKTVSQHNLTSRWLEVKDSYDEYLLRLVRLLNQNNAHGAGNGGSVFTFTREISLANIGYAAALYNTVKEGVQNIAHWTSIVQQTMAWKYTHPVDISALGGSVAGDDSASVASDGDQAAGGAAAAGSAYERAIKYNFSKSELNVLVEIISMIKSVTALLYKHESVIAPVLRFHMHHAMQQLAQGDLLPILHRSDKRSKEKQAASAFTLVMQIRQLVADWVDGKEPIEDYKAYSRKQGQVNVTTHPARAVSAGATQLAMVRGCVRSLFDTKSEAMQAQGMFAKSVLEPEDVARLQSFYYDSAWFPALLSMSSTLRMASDVSDLLFREFYLDLTHSVQFPIEHSLPWILTEHVVMLTSGSTKAAGVAKEAQMAAMAASASASDSTAANAQIGHSSDVPMLENIVFVLDIYNDAAHRALHEFRQQYLYDEIEAEANLVFDQFVFLIADEIYTHYKNRSASQCVDVLCRQSLEELRGMQYLTVAKRRYETLLQQKHIQLLGRSIDLNYLITQHINNKLYYDLDAALKRFESSDFASGIIELQSVLHVIRHMHTALSAYCDLDAFDGLLSEVNVSYSPMSFEDRISNHTCLVIMSDLITNYSYNSVTERFVRSPVALKPVEYGKTHKHQQNSNTLFGDLCSRTFDMCHKLTRSYVGRAHWEALVAVLGPGGMSLLVDKCMHSCLEKMASIKAYMSALHSGIPPTKQPQYVFKPYGCFGYFDGKLKSLLEYDDLKPEVFQGFREIGNMLLFLRDLSTAVCICDQIQFIQVAPLLNITPRYPLDLNQYDFTSSPLYKSFNGIATKLNAAGADKDGNSASKKNVNYKQLVKSNFIVNQTTDVAGQLKTLFSHAVGHKDMFKYCLCTVENFMYELDLYNEWGCRIQDDGSLSSTSVGSSPSNEFHRLWSAMNFLFNTADVSDPADSADGVGMEAQTELPDEAEFGDGFNFAGCLFIHLLGQRNIFQVQDFATHVLSVHEYDTHVLKENDPTKQIPVDRQLVAETNRFVKSAARQYALQQQAFQLFESVSPNKATVAMEDYSNSYNPYIVKCTPPTD